MRHGRPDWNKRIVDLAGQIPEDEPVFLIRGQDRTAVFAVTAYVSNLRAQGAPAHVIARAQDQLDAIMAFQGENPSRVRMPD